jgi:small-conductance mechanosensitive channel
MNIQNVLARLDHVLAFELFTVQESPVTLYSILFFFLVIAVTILISRYVRSVFRTKFADRFEGGLDFTVQRLIHYTILVIGFFVALETVGLSLSSLAIVAGFLSVGIGFGLQNIASNFISGLILLFERPIKVGDMVTVDDNIGTIQSINLRATEVKTVDNIDIIIPNSAFVEQNVTNWSHGEEKIRLRCPFGVAYGSDTELVKEVAEQVARNHEEVLDDPEPACLFQGFGDSALNFELRFWVSSPRKRAKILSEINFDLDEVCRGEGIEMPYPQRDLHIRSNEASFSDSEPETN